MTTNVYNKKHVIDKNEAAVNLFSTIDFYFLEILVFFPLSIMFYSLVYFYINQMTFVTRVKSLFSICFSYVKKGS